MERLKCTSENVRCNPTVACILDLSTDASLGVCTLPVVERKPELETLSEGVCCRITGVIYDVPLFPEK